MGDLQVKQGLGREHAQIVYYFFMLILLEGYKREGWGEGQVGTLTFVHVQYSVAFDIRS